MHEINHLPIYYYLGHPMKPHRVRITHNLVVNYELTNKMEIYKPKMVTANELTRFLYSFIYLILQLLTIFDF